MEGRSRLAHDAGENGILLEEIMEAAYLLVYGSAESEGKWAKHFFSGRECCRGSPKVRLYIQQDAHESSSNDFADRDCKSI